MIDTPKSSLSKPLVVTALVLAVVLGAIFGWRALRSAPAPMAAMPPLPVSAMRVVPQDVPAALEAIGTLEAVRELMLAPEVAGRVVAIQFNAGDRVKAGQTLVKLYDAPEQADRTAALADAALARTQFDRAEALAPKGAVSKAVLDQRRAERDRAEAAIGQLDARISQKSVRAPFSGEIGLRRIDLGQYLAPGEAIATLTSLDELHVNFTVPQQDLGLLRQGAQVAVTADAWPGRTFTARVQAIEPRISSDTRNVTVQAVLANDDEALKPGMYVKVALTLAPETARLVVPATAIMTSAMGDSVVVVRDLDSSGTGTAEIVEVSPGRRIGDRVVVASGLKPRDVVVTTGQIRIQPGQKVRVTAAPVEG
jgi:multidrug efflux system membrane fusion protein